jgi:hypothetical protein
MTLTLDRGVIILMLDRGNRDATPLDLWTDMSRFHKAGLCNCARPHGGFKATKA